MEKLTNSLLKAIKKWTKKAQSKMKAALAAGGKTHTNLYKKFALTVKVEKEGTVTIEANLGPSAMFVEKGRRPGKQPPLNSIKAWCKTRGIPSKAAFPIARTIGERGIKPTPFMKPLTDLQELLKEMGVATVEAVREEVKEAKKEIENKQ